jgi:hypothetical protein
MVCSAVSVFFLPVQIEHFNGGSKKQIPDFIQSIPQYNIEKKQTVALVKEVQIQDAHVKEFFNNVQKVNRRKVDDKMDASRTSSEKGISLDFKKSLTENINTVNNEYYVQVSSWKNYKHARSIFIRLRKHYHNVSIVEQNNFYKVRITGVMTKKQGTIISKKIEKQFSMKPLLVKKIHNTSLADAVRPFIGTSYTKINCYGLIVRGLMNQGVQYHGQGGLREKLENQAERAGLPNNAYLNGEGLIEKGGIKLFSKSMYRISNMRGKTDEVYSEIAPYLQEGLVMSFSTTTRGHTGIVSKQEDVWTYINSGVINNPIYPERVSERVGEEFLQAEIENWFVIAARKKEPLTITLGQLDANQLRDFGGS